MGLGEHNSPHQTFGSAVGEALGSRQGDDIGVVGSKPSDRNSVEVCTRVLALGGEDVVESCITVLARNLTRSVGNRCGVLLIDALLIVLGITDTSLGCTALWPGDEEVRRSSVKVDGKSLSVHFGIAVVKLVLSLLDLVN